MNILLIEDNDLEVEILKRGLRKLGQSESLVRARDGIEALEVLNCNHAGDQLPRPYVILLDINMPRMNGHEFLEEVRKSSTLCDTNVFMFTTSDSKKDIALAHKNNANGYIVKPDSASDLDDILQTLKMFWKICKFPEQCPSPVSS